MALVDNIKEKAFLVYLIFLKALLMFLNLDNDFFSRI